MNGLFKERLDTVFIRRGISTHRRVRRLLQKHNVCVNGSRVLESGFRLNLALDKISIDGIKKNLAPDIYLMMNKQADSICSTKDNGLYKTVYSFVPKNILNMQKKIRCKRFTRLDGWTQTQKGFCFLQRMEIFHTALQIRFSM